MIFTIKHCLGEETVIADTLLRYSPEDIPEILLDISINHVYINAKKTWGYQLIIKDDPLLSVLTDMIIAGWPDDIKDVPKALWNSLTVKMDLFYLEKKSLFPPERGRRSWNKFIKDTWAHQSVNIWQSVYWLGINKDFEQQIEECPTCQKHQPQEPRQPLKPTPSPEWPWQ